MLTSTKRDSSRSSTGTLTKVSIVPLWLNDPIVPTNFGEGNIEILPATFVEARFAIGRSLLPPVRKSSSLLRMSVDHQKRFQIVDERYGRLCLVHTTGFAYNVDSVHG